MDAYNGNRYNRNYQTVTDIVEHESISYNTKYLNSDILNSLFTDANKYVIKELGAGFTYGCLNLKHNIVLIAPNIQIVKDKEAQRFQKGKNKNALFFYGGSPDNIRDIPAHIKRDKLIIMCTIDQFMKFYTQVQGFHWVFDEVHSLNVGGLYRPPIMKLFEVLEQRTNKTIVVTATPSINIPHIFNDYNYIRLLPKILPKKVLHVTTDQRKAVKDIKRLIALKTPVGVFSNSKNINASLMQLTECSIVSGSMMKSKLLQYDTTKGNAFEKNHANLLFLNTSAGMEGHDILTTPNAQIFIFNSENTDALKYTLPAMIQATGRFRNGYEKATIVFSPDNKEEPPKIEKIDIQVLGTKSIDEATDHENNGSPKLIDKTKAFLNDGQININYFGLYGSLDIEATQSLFYDKKALINHLQAYGYTLGTYTNKTTDTVLPQLKVRQRIDNIKAFGIDNATGNFYTLKKAFNPFNTKANPITPTELKVVLIGISELTLNTLFNNAKEVNRMLMNITPQQLELLPHQIKVVIKDIQDCERLYRKYKKTALKPLETTDLEDLDRVFKKHNHTNLPATKENKCLVFKKSRQIVNNVFKKYARIYQNAYIFQALDKEILTVKNREYSPITSLPTQAIADLTPDYILECDVTSANPQFIDNILGSNIGTTVYENLMNSRNSNPHTPNITRNEAKVIYNTALNKADVHQRKKPRTIKIFLDSGYTQKQAETLYQKTKIKGAIYLEMTRQEKQAIEYISNIEPIKNWFGGVKVRRHDSILYYSENLPQLQELEKMLQSNMTENLIYHTKIYNQKPNENTTNIFPANGL